MLTLRELQSRHATLLVIDAASSLTQVGLLRAGEPPVWRSSEAEAGWAVFAGVDELLRAAGADLGAVDGFVYSDGPGSVLGIRTVAVALRTWRVIRARPAFAYGGLDLVAKFQLQQGRPAPFSVIADARRDTWHEVRARSEGAVEPMRRCPPEALTGPLLMPEHFRCWAALPAGTERVPYSIAEMLGALPGAPLFRESAEPDAFLHEEPVYQKWTPQVHRAPS